jgi:hypothetical protein
MNEHIMSVSNVDGRIATLKEQKTSRVNVRRSSSGGIQQGKGDN